MLCYLYLRASTRDQNASRAESALRQFAADNGLTIVGAETENESGALLNRPALFKILNTAPAGAAILVEQVDRLSRLNDEDWQTLRRTIEQKKIKIIALDLPTSHQLAKAPTGEQTEAELFTARMFEAINGMMLDMLAAIARKDYADRRRRQAEGIAQAKEKGHYKGRPTNEAMHAEINRLLDTGDFNNGQIAKLAGCGLSTVKSVARARREAAAPTS